MRFFLKKSGRKYANEKECFTFLDLCVIVVIAFALAAILIPVTAQSAGVGRETVCINNLKTHAKAFASYLNDNNKFYPAPYITPVGSGALTSSNDVVDFTYAGCKLKSQNTHWLNSYLQIPANVNYSNNAAVNAGSMSVKYPVLYCPSDTKGGALAGYASMSLFGAVGNSYVYNGSANCPNVWNGPANPQGGLSGKTASAVKDPKRCVLVSDYTCRSGYFKARGWKVGEAFALHDKTGELCNMAFADGHAVPQQLKYGTKFMTPASVTGFLKAPFSSVGETFLNQSEYTFVPEL